uniref:Protein kinase domain-containing protein n=1 Tax=Ditylenchus dipsaci TaxID=166011 RepID=A0A915DML9_9BILA
MGIQTIQAIRELHTKCRYVCRDVKPSNFVIGLGEMKRQIYIIDFGLCRKYLDRFNNVLQSRGKCHFRMDLGRKDDIESWFYMLVEATTGRLPWQNERDREKCICRRLKPERYHVLHSLLHEPPYSTFVKILEQICADNAINSTDAYDWEMNHSDVPKK